MNPQQYLDQLIQDCQHAKLSQASEIFIYDQRLIAKNSHAIYIIREINANPSLTFEKFNTFKQDFKHKKCPHPNHPSEVLYVGSSRTNLNKRLAEHTTKGADSTFALRLYDWFDGQYEIEVQLYQNISASVLQLIEDNLAHNLKPAFGKRGSNNK